MMVITAQQLIDEARTLIGTPWRHQGRTRRGVDCIGLVTLAAKNAGLDIMKLCGIRPPANYGRDPDPRLFALVEQQCTRISAPVAGCLLFFQFDSDKHPRHFGLFTDAGTVIHAESKTRRQVVEHGHRAHWARWTHSLWLLPGVRYE
jgi:cell wall-associated NlpC family hydrolase